MIDIMEKMINSNEVDFQTSYRESFEKYLKNPTGDVEYWDKLVEPTRKYNEAIMTNDNEEKRSLLDSVLEELEEVCEWEKNNSSALGQEHAKALMENIIKEINKIK